MIGFFFLSGSRLFLYGSPEHPVYFLIIQRVAYYQHLVVFVQKESVQHGIGGQLGVGPAEDACGVHVQFRCSRCSK